jgi:hypothetical protein
MMIWCGLIVTASRRIASPLRTPKTLQKTAPATWRNVAGRGEGGGVFGSESGVGIRQRSSGIALELGWRDQCVDVNTALRSNPVPRIDGNT